MGEWRAEIERRGDGYEVRAVRVVTRGIAERVVVARGVVAARGRPRDRVARGVAEAVLREWGR